MTTISRALLTTVLFLCPLPVALRGQEVGAGPSTAIVPAGVEGTYVGAFRRRGADWPVRFDLRQDGDELRATLDLPRLGMIAHPIPARLPERGLAILDVPFGLGGYALAVVDDTVITRGLGGGGIELVLEIAAPERAHEHREVTFPANDGLDLSGTLYLPRGPGPHAAVVLLHGSSQAGREDWAYVGWGPFYASRGLAALVYDKRTGGADPDLDSLAEDAAAAHAWMRRQPGIDGARVGLGGGSQAGWLGAHLAARPGTAVAFLIMSGWPAGTPREQDLQALRHGMLDDGFSFEDVEEAEAYAELLFHVARDARLWDAFQPRVTEAATMPWGDYVNRPEALEDLSWWSRNLDFGGEKDLVSVTCPVLALYGARDWVVPPSENVGRLEWALARAGNEDVTTLVFPEADHRGEVSFRDDDQLMRWPRLAPGWLESIGDWLVEHDLGVAP